MSQRQILSKTIACLVGAITCNAMANEFHLEEIVVTAQKRSQNLQDIGVAISAFEGETLREQGIHNGNDLERVIPNFSSKSSGGLVVPIVRGIGLQNFRINDSPTSSYYIDEVYQTSVAAAAFSMYDLERVEVLKGPQGGIYGRNTIAAAIQIISKKPTLGEPASGELSVGYGRYGTKEAEFGATFPISDETAIRVSGRWEDSDRAPHESVESGRDFGTLDRSAMRIQLRHQPNEDTDLLFKLHGGSDDSELAPVKPIGAYTNIGTADGLGFPGLSLGLLGGLLAPGTPGTGLCSSVLEGRGSDPQSCASFNGFTPDTQGINGRFDVLDPSLKPQLENDWLGASAVVTLYRGDYTFTSVSSYDTLDYRRDIDFDGTSVQSQDTIYNSEIDFWAQEFRLAYDSGENLNWLLGFNYARDRLKEDTTLYGAEGVLPVLFSGAVSSPQTYNQETEAWALFGRGEWGFQDNWRAIAELRYTDAEKSFEGTQLFGFSDGSTLPFFSADENTSFDAFSGKLALEWTPTDEALIYASVSRGFKTGGYFGGFLTSADQFDSFDEETIISYELGFKADWLDNRLRVNGSTFFYDRRDVQQSASNPSSTNARVARLTNIGDVESSGAELDITWLPTQSLQLTASLGYVDSEVVDSDFVSVASLPFVDGGSLEDTNIANYSKLSANLIGRYEHTLSDSLTASVQLEYSYRSERDLTHIVNPEIEKPLFQEPSYDLINLRVGLASSDDKWRVTAFVENLSDEKYRVAAGNDGLVGLIERYGAPRVWGVNFDYSWN